MSLDLAKVDPETVLQTSLILPRKNYFPALLHRVTVDSTKRISLGGTNLNNVRSLEIPLKVLKLMDLRVFHIFLDFGKGKTKLRSKMTKEHAIIAKVEVMERHNICNLHNPFPYEKQRANVKDITPLVQNNGLVLLPQILDQFPKNNLRITMRRR